jgi:hypothetical protein
MVGILLLKNKTGLQHGAKLKPSSCGSSPNDLRVAQELRKVIHLSFEKLREAPHI